MPTSGRTIVHVSVTFAVFFMGVSRESHTVLAELVHAWMVKSCWRLSFLAVVVVTPSHLGRLFKLRPPAPLFFVVFCCYCCYGWCRCWCCCVGCRRCCSCCSCCFLCSCRSYCCCCFACADAQKELPAGLKPNVTVHFHVRPPTCGHLLSIDRTKLIISYPPVTNANRSQVRSH